MVLFICLYPCIWQLNVDVLCFTHMGDKVKTAYTHIKLYYTSQQQKTRSESVTISIKVRIWCVISFGVKTMLPNVCSLLNGCVSFDLHFCMSNTVTTVEWRHFKGELCVCVSNIILYESEMSEPLKTGIWSFLPFPYDVLSWNLSTKVPAMFLISDWSPN